MLERRTNRLCCPSTFVDSQVWIGPFHKLWLEGLSQRDFEPALRALLGEAGALSASTIARVVTQFRSEFVAWERVGSITSTMCTPGPMACTWAPAPPTSRRVILVVMGADAQGEKHLVALDEAMSESEMSWREIMHDLKARGLRAPRLAVADGANGFWAALQPSIPRRHSNVAGCTRSATCSTKCPKTQGRGAPQVGKICGSTTRAEAMSKIDALAVSLSKDYPKAAACVRDDVDRMLAVLRVPPSELEGLAHHQSDRVGILERPTAHQRCETTAQRLC